MPTTSTNFGALTTTFIPPSDCTTLDFSFFRTTDINALVGYKCSAQGDSNVFGIAESCFPGKYGSYINSGRGAYINTLAVYSPASVCPQGLAPSCSVVKGHGIAAPTTGTNFETANAAIWSALKDGETAIGCCPVGFACAESNEYLCLSTATVGNVLTGITRGDSCVPTTTTVTVQSSHESDVATARRVLLIQSTSVTTTTANSPQTTASPTTGLPGGQTSSDSSGQGVEQGYEQSGLPLGVKIAIGVAVPLVVILAAGAVFFFLFFRRKRNTKRQMSEQAHDPSGKPELEGSGGYAMAGAHGSVNKPEPENLQYGSGAQWATTSQTPELGSDFNAQRTVELQGSYQNVPELSAPIATGTPELHGNHYTGSELGTQPTDFGHGAGPQIAELPDNQLGHRGWNNNGVTEVPSSGHT